MQIGLYLNVHEQEKEQKGQKDREADTLTCRQKTRHAGDERDRQTKCGAGMTHCWRSLHAEQTLTVRWL